MFNTGAMELEIPGIADGARRPSVVVSYGLGLDSTCLLLRWLTEPQSGISTWPTWWWRRR